jgi:hypothetical protein
MAAMTKGEFAVALGWIEKNVGGRLAALGLLVTCGRCLGSGKFSYCQQYGDKCFACMGCGKALPKLTAALVTTVQEKVAAGELAPYFATCKAKAEARKALAPLIAAANAAYLAVAHAYTHETRGVEAAVVVVSPVFRAQGLNNALYYGDCGRTDLRGADGKMVPARMSVSDVESALKYNEIDALAAIAVIRERLAQIEALRDAYFAFSTTSNAA